MPLTGTSGSVGGLGGQPPRSTRPGLAHLKGLTRLRYLGLSGTQCTTVGLAELQTALPDTAVRP